MVLAIVGVWERLTDIYNKRKRSWIMSRIRASGTKIERATANLLHSAGVAFEAQPKGVFGKPDFVIRSEKIAIFCDSDFWHGYRMGPKRLAALAPFWMQKILGNKRRDRQVDRKLRSQGWQVVRLRERQVSRDPAGCVWRIKSAINIRSDIRP